jgi:fructose-bisphosphate aldolase class II
MHTLREYIQDAEAKKIAIGHFNISDTEALKAVFFTAKKLNVPVIIGVSEGERDFIGVREAVALVHSLREGHHYPVFLNADHTYSFERIKEAVDAGFDSVIIDGAKLSLDDNIALSKKSVEYVHASGKDTIIEGELGYIGTSSKILDEIPEGASITGENLTKAVDLKRYVDETGVDLVAPAVGNLHGMLRSGKEPALNIALVKELREACGRPMVLNGGSGTSDQDFRDAIAAGISIVHINTEIRVAYRKGLETYLRDNPDEVAPYKFMAGGVAAMEKVVEARLRLFNSLT